MDKGQDLARLLSSLPLCPDTFDIDFRRGEILLASNRPFVLCSGEETEGGFLRALRLQLALVLGGSGDALFEARALPAYGKKIGMAVLYRGADIYEAADACREQATQWGSFRFFPFSAEDAIGSVDDLYRHIESSRAALNAPAA